MMLKDEVLNVGYWFREETYDVAMFIEILSYDLSYDTNRKQSVRYNWFKDIYFFYNFKFKENFLKIKN